MRENKVPNHTEGQTAVRPYRFAGSPFVGLTMPFPQRFYRNLFWLISIILTILLLVQPVSRAQSLDDWSRSQQQENRGWIHDRADLLDWPTEFHLSRRINKLVGRTSAELAIATLSQVEVEQSLRAFGLKLFNAWGIGNRETNNGVLLLVSKNDRRIEIITGKGLGEVLPNAEVSRLIQQEMVPAFQQQQYAAGVTQAVNTIAQRLETRLPDTVFPRWMPDIFVWVPWLIAASGALFALVRTVQVLVVSFTSVRVPIPTQGFNTKAFSSSEILAAYSFPALLDKVSTFKRDRGEEKIPALVFNVVMGGWLLGVGLTYGFWQFVLMHPEAEFWQSDRMDWTVFGAAGSVGLLWGLLVASRFVTRDWPWFVFPLSLLAAALLAGFNGLLGCAMTTAWSEKGLLGMILVAMFAGVAWAILIHLHLLQFKRKRDYRSDRTGNPLQELTPQELESVLTPMEISARSHGKLEFRGWREAELALPLTREQVYLVQRIDASASVCAHCKSYAVDVSEQTVEKTVEITQKSDRKQKKQATQKEAEKETEKVTAVRFVKQTVYSCYFCGCVFAYDQRATPMLASSDSSSSNYISSDSSSSYSSSSSDNSSYDNPYTSDYSSSSSDFGGGSSDGGGAGGDW
jgi:uncharacterized membrane protein YgcG